MAETADGVKLAVIGGGSVFTPELVDLLARRAVSGEIPTREVVLCDVDQARLGVVAGLARRIIDRVGAEIRVTETTERRRALDGASYVLLQLRAGGQRMRIVDEHLGLKYRLPFAETISTCAFGAMLRTAPVYEQLAVELRELALDAWVFSFANPAGILTQYLQTLGVTRAIGLCNIPVITLGWVAQEYQVDVDDVFIASRGLNHLTVADHVFLGRDDVLTQLLASRSASTQLPFDREVTETFPYLLNPYFQYVLHSEVIRERLQQQEKTRGERVLELEGELLAEYGRENIVGVPDMLIERGGYRYSLAVVGLIGALRGNGRSLQYVNVRNGGAVPGLGEDTVVEVPAYVERDQVTALSCSAVPAPLDAIVVAYARQQELLCEGVAGRSTATLVRAAVANPLIRGFEMATAVVGDLIEANRDFIGDWSPQEVA